MLPHYTMASLDITNLYSNIPVTETKTILRDMLIHEHIEPQTQSEILNWYDVITKQNYFTHNNNIVIQKDGLAMGAPSSGLIAEIFLQHLEHLHLTHLAQKHYIINYGRYVDDIFLIFDSHHTDIHNILDDFNALHPKMTFTAEVETNQTLNFLDINIQKTPTNFKVAVYRKPTFTDVIIPYTSNHPAHHKYAAARFLYNRLNSYDLQHKEYQTELNTIHNILRNNSFPIKPHSTHTKKPTLPKEPKTPPKWASFTYFGKETSYITNVFRHTELKIALRTNNTIGKLLTPKNHTHDPYSQSGAYKLTCPDCGKAYVGQTGRQFSVRYKEHKTAFRNNNQNNSFAKHLNDSTHSFGPMTEIMRILHYHNKGPHLNTLEKFHIHTEAQNQNHLNDEHTIFPNPIFDVLSRPIHPSPP
jgi:hypothetical protein